MSSQTDTEIVCLTSNRYDTLNDPTLSIYIPDKGYVATKGLIYRYVKRWTDPETWGYDSPPLVGEAVHIPTGFHLLMDADSTPVLSVLTVEGSLIFAPDADPNHVRTFDAYYIMVNGGTVEVGTEEYPYTSKLIITMHSTEEDPHLPLFGNKVIAV